MLLENHFRHSAPQKLHAFCLNERRIILRGLVGLASSKTNEHDFPVRFRRRRLSGNEIDLATSAGITNNSANVQTITANIDNNGANKVHNTFAGSMVYSGLFRNNSIIKEGTFSLKLSGTVGNSGVGAIINAGTLILAKATGNAIINTVLVNTNGTLRIAGPVTDQIHFNQRVIMNGGVFQQQNTNAAMATLEEFASLSGSNLNSIVENGLPIPPIVLISAAAVGIAAFTPARFVTARRVCSASRFTATTTISSSMARIPTRA